MVKKSLLMPPTDAPDSRQYAVLSKEGERRLLEALKGDHNQFKAVLAALQISM